MTEERSPSGPYTAPIGTPITGVKTFPTKAPTAAPVARYGTAMVVRGVLSDIEYAESLEAAVRRAEALNSSSGDRYSFIVVTVNPLWGIG